MGPDPPTPPMSRSCAPTLDAPFNDAGIYGPLCTTLGKVNTCPSPLCSWSGALSFASSVIGQHASTRNTVMAQTGSSAELTSGHGLVGYIQKAGSAEICTMRSTMGNADGNYGPLTRGGDACGSPPGTAKKVLAYNGDGSDLRQSQAGSGPYWVNPQETDASCSFAPGDQVNAYVYISGNHGGTAKWEFRKLVSGEGEVRNGDFQMIPNALWNYGPEGPSETSKSVGAHTETFALPADLEPGWHTLRWNWIAPGNVQFVHCIEVQIEGAMPTSSPMPVPSPTPDPPAPPMSRSCVPTLDAPFNDASIYGPLCTTLGNVNTCPAPLCRWSGALSFASSSVARKGPVSKKSHHFLGVSLMQDRMVTSSSMMSMQELSQEEDEIQLAVHAP